MTKILAEDLDHFEKISNPGEKYFRNFIEDVFRPRKEKSCLYFEPFGTQKFPDFLFFNQVYGFLFFEVKNLTLNQIISVDTKRVKYKYDDNGHERIKEEDILGKLRGLQIEKSNELEDNKGALRIIEKFKNLINPKIPLMSGNSALVFTKINRTDALKSDKFKNIDKNERILFKDDIDSDNLNVLDVFKNLTFNKKEEIIQESLFNQLMCYVYEPSADSAFIKKNDSTEFSLDIEVNKNKLKAHKLIIETLDNEQRSYNKFVLNGGYRFIRGIAGSGKTLIVVLSIRKLIKDYEKQQLFNVSKPKILILFYTSTLKKYYTNVLKEIKNHVDVFTFWDFLNKKFNLSIDDFGRDDNGNIKIGEAALSKVTSSHLLNYYDYIFIDEAQDFYEPWGALVYQMCAGSDSKEKNVIAVFDSRQDIYGYGNKDIYKSFKTEEEVKLTGRTKILTKCYRNTKPIFELAQLFTNESYENTEFSIEDGILPKLEEIRDIEHFIRFISQLIKHNQSNVSLNDICVIYPSWHIRSLDIEAIISKLPRDYAQLYSTKRESNFSFKHNSIKFISSNLAKGLEFPLVVLYGFDKIPESNAKINNLYYTAITRAQFELIITYQTLTPQIQAIQNHIQKLK